MINKNKIVNYKKLIIALILTSLALSLTACDDNSSETSTSSNLESVAPDPNDGIYELNETATLNKMTMTITNTKLSDESTKPKPEEGNEFLGIEFTVENTSDKDITINSLLSFDAYQDDEKIDISFVAGIGLEVETINGSIAPGKKLVGYYPVEVTKDWKKIKILVNNSFIGNEVTTFLIKHP